MDLGKSAHLRLAPEDEYTHPIEAAPNFNESMYINLFDHQQKVGGWFRVGNRPNEGHAEMSCCIYLPDGRVGFMFQRPKISNNDALNAAGMKFEVVTPLEHLRLTYSGMLCLMENPQDLSDPKKAFSENPLVPARIRLDFQGISPVFGGEAVDEHGHPIEENPEDSFARAHYEQHMSGHGSITVGDDTFEVAGLGLRDHSWGPRFWQNLYWYRWLPMAFSENFAINVSLIEMADGRRHVWGMVLDHQGEGEKQYDLVTDVEFSSRYDARDQATGQTVTLSTVSGKRYEVTGEALTTVPLRNRRRKDNGEMMMTRITEAMSRYHCNDQTGYGMAEYLDQIIDGKPVGMPV